MKRSIWFWLSFVIALILAIYFSVRVIMTGMGRGNIARVRNISISADVGNKDLSALAAAAAVVPGTNVYKINLDEMNQRIGAVPGVRESAVRRMPNGNLAIKVAIYRAVALWTDGVAYYPLSADGTIVNKPTDVRDEGNVVFRGSVPKDVANITKQAHNLVGDLDYIEWIENRRWNLYTNGGIVVMLPEKNYDDAINNLVMLNNNHGILGKNIKVIDMRDQARVLVK